MMENFEKVEKLVEKTGVSYEEAKDALERNNYDLLDAVIALEKQGKVKTPKACEYTTKGDETASDEFRQTQQAYEKDCNKNSVGQMVDRFFQGCGKVLKKLWDTKFVVVRFKEVVIKVPVLVLLIALCSAFWFTFPLLIVGLFFDFRYNFVGVEDININLNEVCNKASDIVDSIMNDNDMQE